MGLFGNTPRAPVRDIALQQYEPPVMREYNPPRGRGLFGGMGRISPDQWNIIGATLHQLGGQQGAINEAVGGIRDQRNSEMDRMALAEQQRLMNDYRERVLQAQTARQQPEVQHDSRSGTFWIPDPTAPEGYRILGRDPNWQPSRPLIGLMNGGLDDDLEVVEP